MMVNKKSSIRKKSQGDYQKGYVSSAKRGIREKLFLALAVLMLCACSSDDELESSYNGANATGGVAYLTVNLREVGSTTRASDGGYASGLDAEQTIANAYFYFYDDKGNYITSGNVSSTKGTEDSPTSSNHYIEWNSNTVVAVWGLETTSTLPTQMLTVINQPSSFNITGNTLSVATAALAGTPYANASGNFVMSTSTYYSGGIVNTTALDTKNFALEPLNVDVDFGTSGSATPVEVYVERLAAKVEVDASTELTQPILISNINAGSESLENGVYVQLLGWNVDCVARDAYMSKNITDNGNWNGLSFIWNGASNYRTYWAESPNYGVTETETVYPTSSKGYTATEEADSTTGLNKYLRYVDLQNPIAIGGATYCGENTNTTAVLGNASSTALTNVLVKAQAQDASGNPIDIVEYGGSYYTVADFCQNYVYKNFANTIGDAITALESVYPNLTDALGALESAVTAGGSVYRTLATVTTPTIDNDSVFGGEMLSLYNAYDGNVTIGYNTSSTTTDNNIVYSGLTLDDYNFWFSVNASDLTSYINDLTNVGLLEQIGGTYYIPLTEGNTMRSYFLSALAADATATNNSFGTSYPNYFKDGMMYYHVPIEHLGTTPSTGINEGQYGVVRNHWYDVTVTSLSSFGRGIAKEDEVIVPIGDNGIQTNSIGASTKIYSWKEYDQTVIF